MTKESSFGSSRGVLTCSKQHLQPLLLTTLVLGSFRPLPVPFGKNKTKIVIFCTISQEKQVNFLQSKLTSLQKNDKGTFFLDFSGSLGLTHNPQLPNDAYWRYSVLLQFQVFFGYFLLLLEIKIEIIIYCTIFQEKQANLLCV